MSHFFFWTDPMNVRAPLKPLNPVIPGAPLGPGGPGCPGMLEPEPARTHTRRNIYMPPFLGLKQQNSNKKVAKNSKIVIQLHKNSRIAIKSSQKQKQCKNPEIYRFYSFFMKLNCTDLSIMKTKPSAYYPSTKQE